MKELLEDKTSYGEPFFVPVQARWHESWADENGETVPALKDLKFDIGNMLNKAIAAIEDENDSLAGVLNEKDVRNRTRTKTKAAEIEHAIRHHLNVDLDDDPDLQASFSEALAAILEEFRDNWKKI